MRCHIISYMVPTGQYYVGPNPAPPWSGEARAVSKCETHNWMFDYEAVAPGLPDGIVLCPIGRIEQATDEAIERIKKESSNV